MCTGLLDPGWIFREEVAGQESSSPNVSMGQGVELEYTVKSVYAPKALSGRRRCGRLRTKRRTGDKDETSLASTLRAAPLDPVALISGDEDETPRRCRGEDEEKPDVKSGVEEERT